MPALNVHFSLFYFLLACLGSLPCGVGRANRPFPSPLLLSLGGTGYSGLLSLCLLNYVACSGLVACIVDPFFFFSLSDVVAFFNFYGLGDLDFGTQRA